MMTVLPTFAFEWTDLFRGDLLPIFLVVVLGLLTLIKRGIEMLFGARRSKAPPPGRRPGDASSEPPARPEQPTVFEEMKRYFELLEGKPASRSKRAAPSPPAADAPAPLPSGLAPAPPAPRREEVDLDRAFRLPHGSRGVEAAGGDVATTPQALAAGFRPAFAALDSNISISHEELARGSTAARSRRRGLLGVRLTRERNSLRAAVLWSEILGRPRHDRPF